MQKRLVMYNLTPERFGRMFLGTLVLNKQGDIEVVKSMSFRRVRRPRTTGPQYFGEINGKSIEEYYQLIVTISLVKALGWTIDEQKIKNVVIATPPKEQFETSAHAEDFKLCFILEHNAIDDWAKDEVVINPEETCFFPVGDFIDLERHFLEFYAQRMDIFFISDDFKVV